jgi:hypothetical protein
MLRINGSVTLVLSLAAVAFGGVLLEPGRAITAQPLPTRTPEPALPTWPPPRTPTPESTHTSSEAARRVLEQSDQAMNQLRSLTVNGSKFATREMEGTPHGVVFSQFMFPDRFKQVRRSLSVPGPSTEIIIIGRDHWYRWLRAEWDHDLHLHSRPFQWPAYPATKTWEWAARSLMPIDLRLVGPADVAGHSCWQLAYDLEAPSLEGPYRIHIVE